jgi:hypothetical protein
VDLAETRGFIGGSITGRAEVEKASERGFPRYRLVADRVGGLAEIGRYSWFAIYLGKGQRIVLPSGAEWRLRAVGFGSAICPVIVDEDRRKVAQAFPGTKNYGINGPDYAYVLYSAMRRRGNDWLLRHHETDSARFTRRPRNVEAVEPVPVAAVLLSFVVMQFGVPGDEEHFVPRSW